MTGFDWLEVKIDRIKAVTSDDGKPAALSPAEHIKRALGIDDAVAASDVRPTLVYFHWPHEDPIAGKASEKLCTHVLDDETVARWGLLFRCVQVDMSCSDPRLMKLLEAGEQPSFVVVDADANVVTKIAAQPNATKMAKALEDAHAKFPAAVKRVKDALAAQDRALADAKTAMKADKLDDAKAAYTVIVTSNIRVGPAFDKAAIAVADVDQRLARKAPKDGGK
jgi:hypothetical protein